MTTVFGTQLLFKTKMQFYSPGSMAADSRQKANRCILLLFGSDPYGCLRPFCQKERSYLFVLPSSTSTSNIKWYLLDCSSHDCRIIIVASGTINIMLPLRSDSRCRGKIIRVLQRGYQHYFRLNP